MFANKIVNFKEVRKNRERKLQGVFLSSTEDNKLQVKLLGDTTKAEAETLLNVALAQLKEK